jgi:hypothetical protein
MHELSYNRKKEITQGGAEMIATRNERIEFNPQKDLLGWMLKKKQNRQTITSIK